MTKTSLISDIDVLQQCIDECANSKWIGLDIEFLREKTYYPLLCLIQIASESGEYCIDALAIDNLNPLHALLGDPEIVKIIHSCRQDLEALDLRLDNPIQNLFDTQVAAAFCGQGEQVSYAALVEQICDVILAKSHTRADWSKRPLSSEQLEYARDDVRYLNQIREDLVGKLVGLGRESWHSAECERILGLKDYQINPKDAWKRLKGGVKVPGKFQNSAKMLAIWREKVAQKRDRPREWILSTQALIEICQNQPKSLEELSNIEFVRPGIVRYSGDAILKILQVSENNGETAPIWQREEALTNEQRAIVRELMKTLKQAAEDENIGQSVLANRNDIESMVMGNREILLLKGWRYEFIGKDLLAEATQK